MLGTALEYIAAAFFIARISLAAAIAPGVPCLSGTDVAAGAGGFCCATAGTAVRARARPVADKMLERHFIPILLRWRGLPTFNNANSLRACQNSGPGEADEQSMLDNAGYRGQQSRQARSIH